MEAELQDLRELVAQLRADNLKLQQAQVAVELPGPDAATTSATIGPPVIPHSPVASPSAPERFVFVPRDRRCPKFNGKTGMGIDEWVEEAQACMRLRHLSSADQAFFLFDHLGS